MKLKQKVIIWQTLIQILRGHKIVHNGLEKVTKVYKRDTKSFSRPHEAKKKNEPQKALKEGT